MGSISFGSPTDLSDSTVMVKVNPHVDLDIVINLDAVTGKPTQIEVTGLGKTTTRSISYPENQIVIATVIT